VKRDSNLIEKIADPDNLRLAFWKAKKGKANNRQMLLYQNNLDANLHELRENLLNGNVLVGKYNYFTIFDPKERIICAAAFGERVLHHALMNVCHANFERFQIFHSYASRIAKGTYAALEQACIYQKRYAWFLKLDVRKYFDNIDHPVLNQQLSRRFKDKLLLHVFKQIIDSYHTSSNKGLPIGNLTSQYFANHYLSAADHYAKENLQIPAYVRYMDDIVIWSNDKNDLLLLGKEFQRYVSDYLKLELKPFCLNSCRKGLSFLGYCLYPDRVKLSNQSKKRFTGKFKRYAAYLNSGWWDQDVYQRHILPLLAFVGHADTYSLRNKIINKIELSG